jgi:hypothetical protein
MVFDAELFQSHFCCRTIMSVWLSLREMFSPAANSLTSADCADEQRSFGKASNLPNFGALVFRLGHPQPAAVSFLFQTAEPPTTALKHRRYSP